MPQGGGIGVSRRLPDKRARAPAQAAREASTTGEGGLIVRTAAQGAKKDDFEREIDYLHKLNEVARAPRRATSRRRRWSSRRPTCRSGSCATCSRSEFDGAIIDDQKQHQRVTSFFQRTAPELVDSVELYSKPEPLFER